MTTNVPLTALVSVITSIASTLIAFAVREQLETKKTIRQTLLGLCVDCAGTIRAFEAIPDELTSGLVLIQAGNKSLDDDFKILRALPSGIVVPPSLGLGKELVNLLSTDSARSVFLYYDNFDRFAELEKRYRSLFVEILDELAKANFDPEVKRHYDFLRDERFEQLQALVVDLRRTINKLCAHSCEILLMSQGYLDYRENASPQSITEGRFEKWQEIRDTCKKFHGC